MRTDANGVLQWEETFDVAGFSIICWGGILTADGGYALYGTIQPDYSGDDAKDAFLMKINSDLTMAWYMAYGGDLEDGFWNAIPTADGGYAMAGYTTVEAGGTHNDGFVVKTDANGMQEWASLFGETDDQSFWSIYETSDGNFALAGMTGDIDAWVLDGLFTLVDAGGNLLTSVNYHFNETTDFRVIRPVYDYDDPSSVTGYCLYGSTAQDVNNWDTSDLIAVNVDLAGSVGDFLIFGTGDEDWAMFGLCEGWNHGCVAVGNSSTTDADGMAVYMARLDGPNMTGFSQQSVLVPAEFNLFPTYPNPFNSTAVISYQVPGNQYARLALYDVLGREVSVLVDGKAAAGHNYVSLDADGLASGTYFLKLESDDLDKQVQKVTLVR